MFYATYYIIKRRGELCTKSNFMILKMANAQYKDFIDSLDAKMKAKTLRTIDLLEANGPSLRKPQSEPMEDGIIVKL